MTKYSKTSLTLLYLFLITGAFVMFIPFYWMVATSIKTGAKVLQMPPQWIPDPLTWQHYITAWNSENVNFALYTFNSTVVTVLDVVGTMISCAVIAFGLAMFDFKLKKWIYLAMVSTLILPGQVTMIPTYFIWKNLNALDSFYPLVVPAFLGGAFGIFLMHQFYKTLPKELFEAALMDGYTPWGVLWRIYIPLSKPALSALAVFTFIHAWSNTLGPLLYLTDNKMFTLPLGLLFLKAVNDQPNETPIVMAGAFIITIPVVILFLFAQKQFIQGMASTGLKG
jgi:multiple sugar transport system permease protein